MKKTLKALILMTAAILMMLCLSGCGTPTIDINKYLVIEASGYDGRGHAAVTFDKDAFARDHEKDIRLSKNYAYLSQFATVSNAEAMYIDCISGNLDKSENLSNGDKIVFHWQCNDAMAETNYGVKLRYKDIEFKVKDLQKMDRFDPFEWITVEFSGTEPAGELVVNADLSHPEIQYLRFEGDRSSGLSNGETVTISLSLSGSDESFIEKFGGIPSVMEKTYTVSGLNKFITSSAEIDEACLEAMKKQAEDVLLSYAAEWSGSSVQMTDYEYAGTAFLMAKNWNEDDILCNSRVNQFTIVYKVSAAVSGQHNGWSNDYDDYIDVLYFAVQFENITKDPEGACIVDLANYSTPYRWIYDDHGYTFTGSYWTIDELVNDLLTSHMAKYYTENNLVG